MTATFEPMVLTLALPILGALLVGTCGRYLGKTGSAVAATTAVGASFAIVVWTIMSRWLTAAEPQAIKLWTWISYPSAHGITDVDFGLYIDSISLTMMAVVTGVGFLIHWYSIEYMEHDDVPRFFALFNIFIAAMTLLVLADNYATLIIGWGGVGFASFGPIGFWREKPSAAAAAKKAFVMNVIGDLGLMVAVFILFQLAGTVSYRTLFTSGWLQEMAKNPSFIPWLTVVVVGLMIAAYAKSAQLPLHTWLPDAMEGPTPVSALIHAATMVTAGVYLLIRSYAFLEMLPNLAMVVAYLGAFTALFSAICAMVQTDIKKLLAYSTLSQLGYMFMAVGVGACGPALFHLSTHAFFKALLFLAAGIVIHAAHGEQDMRKLGGLARQIPTTAVMFAVGGAALAGVPLTAGYFSKESILHASLDKSGGTPLFAMGALVAFMTALYIGRAFCLTFLGPKKIERVILPGAPTTISCLVLTVLSLGAGWLYPQLQGFLDSSYSLAIFNIEPGGVSGVSVGMSFAVVVALFISYYLFGWGQADRLGVEGGVQGFIRKGMGFDELYGFLGRSLNLLGGLCAKGVDPVLSDRLPNFVRRIFNDLSEAFGRELETGQTRFYLGALVLCVAMFLVVSLGFYGGVTQ